MMNKVCNYYVEEIIVTFHAGYLIGEEFEKSF